MTQHILQGRTEADTLWYKRRGFLAAAAAWTSMGGFAAAQAQQRGNVVQLVGEATVNGTQLNDKTPVQTGDRIETGPASGLVFVIGNTAFQVRENTRMTVERGASINAVSVLRILTGAVASVWGKGTSRQIVTPTLTAGIRGTGVYTEVFDKDAFRSYFCNCYGVVDLSAGRDKTQSMAAYHQSFITEREPRDGKLLTPTKAMNHTDEELEFLAGLVNQRTAWQIAGKKGTLDGKGY